VVEVVVVAVLLRDADSRPRPRRLWWCGVVAAAAAAAAAAVVVIMAVVGELTAATTRCITGYTKEYSK